LEKRIEGVERWFLRKNEVLLKVKPQRGQNVFRGTPQLSNLKNVFYKRVMKTL